MARLGFILLDGVNNVNSFREVSELFVTSGEASTLYFRLIDLDSKLRYVPGATATMTVQFRHLDASKAASRAASKVYPSDDRSIWSVSILAGDSFLPDSIEATLVDGATTKKLKLDGSLRFVVSGDEAFYC